MCARVLARSANEGSGTTGWSLAVPVRACFVVDKEDIPLRGSLNNRGVVVYQAKPAPTAASHSSPIQLVRCNNTEGVTMDSLKGLASFVSELKETRKSFADEIRHIDAALTVLGKMGGRGDSTKTGRTMSASARRKISLAQKARWAKANGQAPKAKRRMSAAGRRRIAAAQRRRWAKVRAGKKH